MKERKKSRGVLEMFKKSGFVFVSLCFVISISYAGSKGTTGGQFLKIVGGARPAAMGNAYCAVSDDVNSIGSNPSGLAFLPKSEVTATYTVWFQDIKYNYLALGMPMKMGTLGIAVNMLSVTGIPKTDNTGSYVGGATAETATKFGESDTAITLAYAKALNDKLGLGLSMKIINMSIDDKSASSFAADLGGLYKASEKLDLGLSVQNLGGAIKFIEVSDPLPMNLKIGSKYQFSEKFLLGLDINVGTADGVSTVNLGTEYSLAVNENMSLPLRFGYNSGLSDAGGMAGVSLGLGFAMKNSFGFDATWAPYGDLGDTIRVGLKYSF
ncbi:MAG: hypothetical protein A2297_08630 [Elusimicrobia bacterium RIFOXYB2_FULL_48_7]|nr:MAG: hypothetical protein A2297_08630 [Elusimicrobia bacterium RIFOXYB2_FULL_48_7]